jgi:hypothetical protein
MAASETARLIASLELKDLFSKSVDSATKSLDKFDHKMDSTQSRAYKAGTQIGTGIKRGAALAIAAVGTIAIAGGAVLAKGIRAASDLNETVSKVGVVFGKQSAAVLAFGKNSAQALGLSEQAADEAAATYGNLFVSLGLTQTKAATMSTTMVKLAADLASFNNVSPEEALQALQSGLVGETEPLRKFGINLNDQQLKAEALRLGLVKLEKGQKSYTAVLTPAQKAQAAYALIMQQSKTAQGDFGRTSSGLANQIRILHGNFINLLATLGKPVLPAVAKIFARLNEEITNNLPVIAKLGDTIAGFVTDENVSKVFDAISTGVETVKAAAPFLEASAKATLGFVQAAVGIFKSLPAPLQGLLVGGFALNKLTGGLVTNVAGGILGAVKGARGQSPAIPLYVSDVSGGLGGGAAGKTGGLLRGLGTLITKLGGLALIGGGAFGIGAGVGIGGPAGAGVAAGGGAALIGGGALLAGPLGAIAGSIAAVALTIKDIRDQSAAQGQGISTSVQNEITGGASLADLKKSLAAVDTGINDIQANPLNVLLAGDALDALHKQHDDLTLAIAGIQKTAANTSTANAILDRGGRELGKASGKTRDDLLPLADLLKGISARFIGALATLQHSSDPKAVAAAVKDLQEVMVKNGHGSVAQTKETIAALTAQLKKTITDLKNKVPGREYAQRQIARADQILHSSESVGAKIKGLQTIENDLKNHALPGQTRALQQKIDALRASQAHAIGQTTQAIKDKDLSLKLNVYNPVRVNINARQVAATNAIFSKYFGGTPTGTRAPRGG